MKSPPLPPNEAARLASLRALNILDTAAEARFDRITRLTQTLFDVPIVLVSLVDEKRQWFKSRQGLDATETPRDISFCGHAILSSETFIVEDAAKDPRFSDNPLVQGDPKLRFYAGSPLAAPDGQRVGTLCLIDRKPRCLSPQQLQMLRDLSAIVEDELASLDLQKALEALEASQKTLRQREHELTDYFENANISLHWVDASGIIRWANKAELEFLGYAPEEYIGQPIAKFHADASVITDILTRLANFETLRDYRARLRAKDGTIKHVMINSSTYAENGEFIHTRCFTNDITERMRNEVATARLAAIVASSDDVIISKTLDGVVTSWNRAAEMLFGYPEAEMIGAPAARIFPPDRLHEEALILSDIRAGKRIDYFETLCVSKNGTLIDVSTTISPITDSSGHIIGVSTILRDVRAQKKKEADLKLLLKDLSDTKLALGNSAIVAMTDAQGRITYVNDKFCAISQYSRDELLGQDHRIINSGRHPKEFFRDLWRTISGGGVWSGEICNKAKDGSFYWVDTTITPFLDANGKPERFVAIRADITERKVAEFALSTSRDAALQAAQAKADFLASMSHEIRTPMNSIIGLTGLLLNTGLTAQQKELAGTVRNSGEVLLSLINDILDFSKFESGKVRLEEMPFDLDQLIASTIELVALRAGEKGLKLNVVPQTSPSVLVGDPGRLRQILLNLVANAVKFTEKGEVTVSTDVEVQDEHSSTLRFRVSDTGIGIPKEALSGLFDSFTQADASTTRRFGGTGLGLAIAKKLVTLMGGEIGVESAPDKGSTFWFRVRLRTGQAAPVDKASIALHDKNLPTGEQRARPRREFFRILVVEDNTGNQLVAKLQLRSLGYEPDIVSSGQEALDQLLKIPYDIVIMDCQMPGMDGFAATRALRKREAGRRRTPVIAMTANAFTGDRESCLAAEMDDYISKPVLIEVLEAVIRRWDLDFDPKPLEKLREIAGPADAAMVAEVIRQFLDSSAKTISDLRKAAADNDVQALKNGAHALKGASGNVGALALQRMSRQLEILARSGETQGCAEFVAGLEREFIKVRDILNNGASPRSA